MFKAATGMEFAPLGGSAMKTSPLLSPAAISVGKTKADTLLGPNIRNILPLVIATRQPVKRGYPQ